MEKEKMGRPTPKYRRSPHGNAKRLPNEDAIPLTVRNLDHSDDMESPVRLGPHQPLTLKSWTLNAIRSPKKYLCIALVSVLAITITLIVLVSVITYNAPPAVQTPNLTISSLLDPSRLTDPARVWNTYLPPLLVTRVPGTPSHIKSRDFLVATLKELGWTVELDSFSSQTPNGEKPFHNIIATRHPSARKRLILCAHYDSKYFESGEFIGAIDSAAPCAILLEVAAVLKPCLDILDSPDTSLQLIFFDGEEAWKAWTRDDSLYGSRHLAERWSTEKVAPDSNTTVLQSISLFVLLDLLGAPSTTVYNLQERTASNFSRLVNWEAYLRSSEKFLLPTDPKNANLYFDPDVHSHTGSGVDDDHRPFMERGVPIVHLIPLPFPHVWHLLTDNGSALDKDTVINLSRIFVAFCVDSLNLKL